VGASALIAVGRFPPTLKLSLFSASGKTMLDIGEHPFIPFSEGH
jgi:hypothetical protein